LEPYHARSPLGARIVQLIAVYFFYRAFQMRGDGFTPWILAAVGASLFWLASTFKGDVDTLQSRRNAVAQQIVEQAAAGIENAKSFILYLRSFSVSGQLTVTSHDPLWLRLASVPGSAPEIVETETALVQALDQFAPTVALDRAARYFGAGRVVIPDDQWEPTVLRLMEDADTILVVPGVSSGLAKEFSLLRTGNFISRVIFVMPPCDKGDVDTWTATWASATALSHESMRIRLPPYDPRGLLFSVNPDGEPDASVQFPRTMTAVAISKQLHKLLSAMTSQTPVSKTKTSSV
jgi:hypothetical protein